MMTAGHRRECSSAQAFFMAKVKDVVTSSRDLQSHVAKGVGSGKGGMVAVVQSSILLFIIFC